MRPAPRPKSRQGSIGGKIRPNNQIQWNLYSRDTLGAKESVPLTEVSPERRLDWGLLIINLQIKYLFFSFCLEVCCSQYRNIPIKRPPTATPKLVTQKTLC